MKKFSILICAWPSKVTLLITCLVFANGCDNKETYGSVDLYEKALEIDPEASYVLGDLAETKIDLCQKLKYGPGCKKVIRAKVHRLQVIFVEFESKKLAHKEARRIDQFYARNWVIDDIAGEPVLEAFVKKAYEAKRPLLEESKGK